MFRSAYWRARCWDSGYWGVSVSDDESTGGLLHGYISIQPTVFGRIR